MRFFLGVYHLPDAIKTDRAFISVHTLAKRRTKFPANEWIMDSGAFTTIKKHGGYPEAVSVYAANIRRFADCGKLLAAVSQDYMCEPEMLARTGLTIADHQRLSIERYDALLRENCGGVPILPVLQGYAPADYVEHIRQYGERLRVGMWVGVGSVCKRNANYRTIEDVLLAIKRERPDLRPHAFGIKATALESQLVRDLLESADSMAWSFAARREGRDTHDFNEAIRYARRIERMSTQRSFFGMVP
jgi:hypothetical protein